MSRPRLQLAQAEADALALLLHGNDLDLHLLADGQDFGGMVDHGPAEFADVDQAVGAADADEGPEVGQAGDHAVAHLAHLQIFQDGVLALVAQLAHGLLLGEDGAVAPAFDVDHLDLQGASDQGLEAVRGIRAAILRHLALQTQVAGRCESKDRITWLGYSAEDWLQITSGNERWRRLCAAPRTVGQRVDALSHVSIAIVRNRLS